MTKDSRFASLFNECVFKGKEIVDPRQLEERDSCEVQIISDGDTVFQLQRNRDILKRAKIADNGIHQNVLFGIESQSYNDKMMPLRVITYNLL